MIGTSAMFQLLVKTDHHAVCQLDVVRHGAVEKTLNIHGGSVDADRTAAQWRRLTCDVADDDGTLTPQGVKDLLTPFGTQLKPYRGVFIPDVETDSQDYTNQADWQTGTLTNMIATPGGALQLG